MLGGKQLKKSSVDLTQGSIWKQLLLFALPIFVGQLFQNLYNSVDSLVVGNFVGKTALAAVSSTNDISHFLVGFFTGLASGGGVFFAQMFGKKDYQKLSDGIHTTILFAFLFGFVMAGVGYWLSPQLLQLISCPPDVYASALEYLRIYLIGILFIAIYNVGAGILRAVGDSSSPFYYLLISSMTNIVLDLLFVCGFNMGVAGVGWATTLAQLVSVILVLRKMMKTHDVYKLEIRKLRLNQPILAEVLRLGIPAGIQTSITSISNMFVQRYTNGFGSSAMAGIGVAKKVEKFAGLSCSSLGVAITTFIGQNYGADKKKRAVEGIRISVWISVIMVGLTSLALFILAPGIAVIFNRDAEVVAYASAMIRVIMPFYLFNAMYNIFSGVVRGFGKSKSVMLCVILGLVGCRQLWLAVSMSIKSDVFNVYFSYPAGWIGASILVYLYYYFNIRRTVVAEIQHSDA